MNALNDESGADVWRQVAPMLDEAMNGLGERDRDALVLRFLEQPTSSLAVLRGL